MAYATVSDLEARWRELSEAERLQAEVLLDDAALIIDSFADIDSTDISLSDRARYVSCSMVERAMMSAASDSFGVNNMSATMGPFTQQVTYANPTGDLYLTATEKKLLGVGKAFITQVRPVIGWGMQCRCR